MVRPAVIQLAEMGPLPSQDDVSFDILCEHQALIELIDTARPVSDEEARVLVRRLGPDTCHGIAWTVVHLIETAPEWPMMDRLEDQERWWICRLRERIPAVN